MDIFHWHNLMLVIFPNMLILVYHGTFLAVSIRLHLNVNRKNSGEERRTEFYTVCFILFQLFRPFQPIR